MAHTSLVSVYLTRVYQSHVHLFGVTDVILCEAKTEGLVHYPTTLAPVSGSVTVTVQCADNAHSTIGTNITCMSDGSWSGTVHCQCNDGYILVEVSHSKKICQGIIAG